MKIPVLTSVAVAGALALAPRDPIYHQYLKFDDSAKDDPRLFEIGIPENGAGFIRKNGQDISTDVPALQNLVATLAQKVEFLELGAKEAAEAERMEHDGQGNVTEVVAYGSGHLERMSREAVFVSLTRVDGSSIAIWLRAKGRLDLMSEEREPVTHIASSAEKSA